MRQEFCGLVVNQRANLPREQRRRIRAILHDLAKKGPKCAVRGRGDGFLRWLSGHLAYVASIDRNEGVKLVKEMEEALAGEADRGSGGSPKIS